jgi:cyclopropane fatty-acyl-phospholipid synthase-like methyltransferase
MIETLPLKKAVPRILEIGGGMGAFTKKIIIKYPRSKIVFVDGSLEMLHNAKKRLKIPDGQISFLLADINDPSWLSGIKGSFDAVVSSWCLHYLSDERRQPFFNEIHGLLRSRGVFLFSCSTHTAAPTFMRLYNEVESARVKQHLHKLGMEVTDAQIRAMARKGHTKARINPAFFDEYVELIRRAGFAESACLWKYLFNTVFAACKGKQKQCVHID